MTFSEIENQNRFLLNFVSLLLADLGAHLAFLDWVKMISTQQDIDGILSQCRHDPDLEPQVAAYMQWLSTEIVGTAPPSPGQAYREFFRLWTELRNAN